jgi:hypothetical protein
MNERRLPAWLRPLLVHVQRTGLRPGSVAHVEVLHDDWCAHFYGRPCNCDPEIRTGTRIDRRYGGRP